MCRGAFLCRGGCWGGDSRSCVVGTGLGLSSMACLSGCRSSDVEGSGGVEYMEGLVSRGSLSLSLV